MLWMMALILLIFWVLGLVFKVAGAFVHVLFCWRLSLGLSNFLREAGDLSDNFI